MKHDVEFTTEDGAILRGVLHTAEPEQRSPLIVMAHGLSGVKEQLDHYAALFADSGFRGAQRASGSGGHEVHRLVGTDQQLAQHRDVAVLEHLLDFEPAGWVPFVAPNPLPTVIGEKDTCTLAGARCRTGTLSASTSRMRERRRSG